MTWLGLLQTQKPMKQVPWLRAWTWADSVLLVLNAQLLGINAPGSGRGEGGGWERDSSLSGFREIYSLLTPHASKIRLSASRPRAQQVHTVLQLTTAWHFCILSGPSKRSNFKFAHNDVWFLCFKTILSSFDRSLSRWGLKIWTYTTTLTRSLIIFFYLFFVNS